MSATDTQAIPKRRFGRHEDEVTIIALGGGHIIRKNIDREMAIEIITAAVDAGINFIDEAWDYGDGVSEMYMGEALENCWDDLFLATKVCARGYAEAAAQIDESLRRLR
ncbi:MAG: aldo/keto reductase, partial [Chloroflexota bacterium]|nr:aldo/keto reductase [Chloroflexota bacterium]